MRVVFFRGCFEVRSVPRLEGSGEGGGVMDAQVLRVAVRSRRKKLRVGKKPGRLDSQGRSPRGLL